MAFAEMLYCCQRERGQLQGSLAQEKYKEEKKKEKKSWLLKDRKGREAFGLHSYDVDPVWQANVSLLGCLD